jgi:Tol biopolymer transport system component
VAIARPGRRTRVPLTTEPSQDVSLARWRGTRLLVATIRNEGSDTDVYTMRPDGGDVRAVTSSGDYEFAPTSSADGSTIAFAGLLRSARVQSALFTIGADGRGRTPLTAPPAGTDDYDPAWSPDGGSIVFVRSHAAEGRRQSDLFVVRPDGADVRQLTALPGEAHGPTWSPDGSQVAFGRLVGWHVAVAVVNADGSGYREVTTAYGSPLPAWSPDGGRLAFVNPNTGGLVVFDLPRGAANEITARAESTSAPAWSPDGSRLVYVAADGDLHSVAASGDGDVRLTSEAGRDQDPDWSRAAP